MLCAFYYSREQAIWLHSSNSLDTSAEDENGCLKGNRVTRVNITKLLPTIVIVD